MQLDFNFEKNNSYHIDDFIVFQGNQEAFNFVNGKFDDDLNNRIFLITGSEKSGKTYLSFIWKKKTNAIFLDFNKMNRIKDIKEFYISLMNFIEVGKNYILEDLEDLDLEEEKLFHLINIINEKKAKLLITSKKLVMDFLFETNDLQSRFQNIINFKIDYLDDISKQFFIIKLFSDKQMNIDLKVVKYLAKNTSNIYKEIYNKVEKIIRNFLQEKRRKKITIEFIKSI
jgi:chromosomal replication initiation ATPase DnaA